MSSYEIAFSGKIKPGFSIVVAKQNLAKMFNLDANKIAVFFSGKKQIIKTNADKNTAIKYRDALLTAGVIADITALADAPQASPKPTQNTQNNDKASQDSNKNFGKLQAHANDSYYEAFQDIDALDFGLAKTGDKLAQEQKETNVSYDLAAFHLVANGSDMNEVKKDIPPPPDANKFKLK